MLTCQRFKGAPVSVMFLLRAGLDLLTFTQAPFGWVLELSGGGRK